MVVVSVVAAVAKVANMVRKAKLVLKVQAQHEYERSNVQREAVKGAVRRTVNGEE